MSSGHSAMSTVRLMSWNTWMCCVPDDNIVRTECPMIPSTPLIRARLTSLRIWKSLIAAFAVRDLHDVNSQFGFDLLTVTIRPLSGTIAHLSTNTVRFTAFLFTVAINLCH